MAIFRVKKTRDFTFMSNHHLRDKKLSLKAKGLLSLILSLPEDWDYTLKGLSYICKEGIDAVRMAVKELEDAGYIERRRFRNEKGQLKSIEYIIEERWIDRYNQNIEFVKSNIEYDGLCTIHDKATLDNIVSIMAEVLTVDRHSYTIEGCEYPAVLIKKRFSDIDYSVMDAFLMQFENKTEKIRNIKAYLITSMYNAPSTASAQIHNAVIHDICGCGIYKNK